MQRLTKQCKLGIQKLHENQIKLENPMAVGNTTEAEISTGMTAKRLALKVSADFRAKDQHGPC